MIVLAIDPGLASTGYALVDGTRLVESGTVHTSVLDGDLITRSRIIATHLDMGMDNNVIEQPFMGLFKGSAETYFLAGFLAGRLPNPHMVHPSTWSKGKGKPKERMEAARNLALKVYKVTKRTSEHERDALAIALWAVSGGVSGGSGK